jgi:hypothetical protein
VARAEQHERRAPHVGQAAQHLPQRVAAHGPGPHATPEARGQAAALRGAHRSVVEADLIGEGAGLPAVHARGEAGDGVDAPARHGAVAADLLEAGTPEELARARDVGKVRARVRVRARSGRAKSST